MGLLCLYLATEPVAFLGRLTGNLRSHVIVIIASSIVFILLRHNAVLSGAANEAKPKRDV